VLAEELRVGEKNEVREMIPRFQSKQSVQIQAALEVVWEFSMDLTKIPSFHPRVFKVDLLSGKSRREAGAAYQCHLIGGKHLCPEKDVEVVRWRKAASERAAARAAQSVRKNCQLQSAQALRMGDHLHPRDPMSFDCA
jgi:hypothetical protein